MPIKKRAGLNSLRRSVRWFLPHRQNDHKPHLIRAHGLIVLAVLMLGIQLSVNILRPPGVRVLAYAVDITPVDLLSQTNQQRADNGLPALRLDNRLNASAKLKTENMFAENYWAHVSPSGIQPWYWIKQAGYDYAYAGENLAKDFSTTSGTVAGWMNSSGHRANILNANYTDVGFAVMNGTLQGSQTTLVVAHYGHENTAASVVAVTPLPKIAAQAPAATIKPVEARSVANSAVAVVAASPAATSAPIATNTSSNNTKGGQDALSSQLSVPTISTPAPQSYSLFRPLALTKSLNWGNIITFVLLTVLLLVYCITHMTVWRKGLRRWRGRQYKVMAAMQVGALVLLLMFIANSGFGSVG
jgi:hypothetical protein